MYLLPTVVLSLVVDFIAAHGSDQSFLDNTLLRKHQVQNVLEHQTATVAGCKHIPTGPIETTKCDYETIESVNGELYSQLNDLVRTPFFRYFRADLYRECPFWQENGLCMNRECGIATVDESEIPEKWRAASLSKVEMPPDEMRNTLPGCYYRDSDFCFLDDMTEGDYIDLTMNPERFTGYSGAPANRVWSSIYKENCFGISEVMLRSERHDPANSFADALRGELEEQDEMCTEKKVYYKIISGLHASISTHICRDYLNQSTGEWGSNLQCFVTRVASHPERLQYIYFNTVLLLRAFARLGPYLSAYDYCSSGTHEEDAYTLTKLGSVIGIASVVGQFDESSLFQGQDANVLKEEFKTHFRNVTRIMDCVGCDKCRLWGKVQTSGLGTALKILFELDERALDPKTNPNLLSRNEVVALVNTLHRFVESLQFVDEFRRMWAGVDKSQSHALIREAEEAVTSQRIHDESDSYLDDEYGPDGSRLPRRWNLFVEVKRRIQHILRVCRVSTIQCLRRVLTDSAEVLRSVFARSDKMQGPHSDL
ncbi:endoplasmic oxidoreductin [Rickenella mellea]|uniref:Endoplasmic oxidoreductin n=1 Tax=Rickenella mellea TaxID=50990 RepID=A0A4Y7QEZ7_9AGAM|nr:endoplasmic oxidoreductin [Rickenella mellea]